MRVPIYIIYFKVLKGKKLVLILVDQNMLNETTQGKARSPATVAE